MPAAGPFITVEGLERVPLAALRDLHMVTPDGRVLALARGGPMPDRRRPFYLYQELCPVHPRIVSDKDPEQFVRHITAPGPLMRLPRLCFVDLRLGELGVDPQRASIHDLPYHAIEHLRDCLIELQRSPGKGTKTVDRNHPQSFPYRSVETGVYVGDAEQLLFYTFPLPFSKLLRSGAKK